MILRTEIYRNCLYYRRYCPRYGLLHIFRTTGNSQYDGHGRDAIDWLAAIRWHLKLPTFALDENGR